MDTPVFFHKGTGRVAATVASSSTTLYTSSGTAVPGVGANVLVYNAGPDLAFVSLGASTVTATVPTNAGTGSMPVPVGFYGLTIARDPVTDTNAAAISLGASTVYFSVGNGT